MLNPQLFSYTHVANQNISQHSSHEFNKLPSVIAVSINLKPGSISTDEDDENVVDLQKLRKEEYE